MIASNTGNEGKSAAMKEAVYRATNKPWPMAVYRSKNDVWSSHWVQCVPHAEDHLFATVYCDGRIEYAEIANQ